MSVLNPSRPPWVLVLLVIAWEGLGMTIHDGIFEADAELKRDIVYWASKTAIPTAGWTDACSSLTYMRRKGSLGRIYTKEENDRGLALVLNSTLDLGLEPSDSAVEGRWVTSDGTIMWENGNCAQKFCNWDIGQPKNYGVGGEAR
ncbi:hypothetical protein DIPPA_58773, partial [Diplonema papillatum]